jgi:membrane protein DedA with SNARE-associated domain
VLITTVGYLFGNAVEMLFGRLKLHLHLLIAIAAIAVIVAALAYLIRRQMRGGSATR